MRCVIGSALFGLVLALFGCEKPPAAKVDPPPAPVVVATAHKKTVPIHLHAIGSVKTLASVAIRPRVSGELTGVFFHEGDFVTQNQKLFTIDPRPYEAAVQQAEANLAKSLTILKGAELDMERAEQARKSGVVAGIDYDAAVTALANAKATVDADRVAVNTAKLQAGFTTITSPISGQVGELLVSRGNLVDANSPSPLAVIHQISPITVAFSLPEEHLWAIRQARQQGPVKVTAGPRGATAPASGELTFIDNTADPLTGTVQFKATFPNTDQKLWPGLFVDVVVHLGQRPESVVIPSVALQTGQRGSYVYLVTPEHKAEVRMVSVAFEDNGEAVIATGLTGGETVVVEGQLRLAAGVKVAVKAVQGLPDSPPSTGLALEGRK
ncbi:MAG: efflux RND transporter periplasmic adaptor subunit [Gemmataceae bacterium]|nr:efflux RND transporter periplasmic adaptor subunit [Gemmata sp.]MDW8197758.1 efflux RND transporter periplasmic adaptor subunit [Gemmataceae bacterium]